MVDLSPCVTKREIWAVGPSHRTRGKNVRRFDAAVLPIERRCVLLLVGIKKHFADVGQGVKLNKTCKKFWYACPNSGYVTQCLSFVTFIVGSDVAGWQATAQSGQNLDELTLVIWNLNFLLQPSNQLQLAPKIESDWYQRVAWNDSNIWSSWKKGPRSQLAVCQFSNSMYLQNFSKGKNTFLSIYIHDCWAKNWCLFIKKNSMDSNILHWSLIWCLDPPHWSTHSLYCCRLPAYRLVLSSEVEAGSCRNTEFAWFPNTIIHFPVLSFTLKKLNGSAWGRKWLRM